MRRYVGQQFSNWRDFDSGRIFQDAEFIDCEFWEFTVSSTDDPKLRSTVRNMQFRNCLVAGSVFSPIVENVQIENLLFDYRDTLQTGGAVFNQVTISGKAKRLVIDNDIGGSHSTKQKLAFNEANAAYYRTVDWALDISRLECMMCEIRNIPSRLIRRDLETQAVVTRKNALEGHWKNLDLSDTPWPYALTFMLHREDEDIILVAPKLHPDFGRYLQGIQLLRKAGIAESE